MPPDDDKKVIASDFGTPGPHLKRGAIPTPEHRRRAASAFRSFRAALPASVVYVPPKLSMWGNNQEGDCVTAEEAFAKACGPNGVFITEKEVMRWAANYGYDNGAMLDEVMDQMGKDGFHQDGHVYGDGGKLSVDYSNPDVLKAALAEGPVKIAIDANALPSGAGNGSGWWKLGGRPGQYGNTDHCVAVAGYGKASVLFPAVGASVPANVDPNADVYLLFTWSGIGVVDQAWLMSTCTEGWIRRPTTTIDGVPQPQPGPGPNPVPPPPPPTPTPTPTPTPSTGYSLPILLGALVIGVIAGFILGKELK